MRSSFIACLILGLAAQAAAPVPRAAGEFTIREATGKTTQLSSQKGKVIVLQFLDVNCGHCQNTAGWLSKVQAEMGPRGLQVYGVAFDPSVNTPDASKNALALSTFTSRFAKFPVGRADRNTALQFMGHSVMDRLLVPQIVVIDRRGMIRAQDKAQPTGELGEAPLRALVNTLLNQK